MLLLGCYVLRYIVYLDKFDIFKSRMIDILIVLNSKFVGNRERENYTREIV